MSKTDTARQLQQITRKAELIKLLEGRVKDFLINQLFKGFSPDDMNLVGSLATVLETALKKWLDTNSREVVESFNRIGAPGGPPLTLAQLRESIISQLQNRVLEEEQLEFPDEVDSLTVNGRCYEAIYCTDGQLSVVYNDNGKQDDMSLDEVSTDDLQAMLDEILHHGLVAEGD